MCLQGKESEGVKREAGQVNRYLADDDTRGTQSRG